MNLKNWFEGQSPRDRKIILAAGVFLAVLVLWGLVYAPFARSVSQNKKQLEAQREMLTLVRKAAAEVQALRASGLGGGGGIPDGMSLAQVVNQVASEQSMQLSRMQPDDEGLQVWLDDVEFNSAVIWLGAMDSSYGIRVSNINVTRGESDGKVKIRVGLRGG